MKRASIMRVAVLAMVFMLAIGAPVQAGAAGLSPGAKATKAVNAQWHYDTITIAEHDRAQMDSAIDVFDDQGEVITLDAEHNQTQDETVGVDFAKIEDDELQQFPRVDGEDENSQTWLNESNWTATGGATATDAAIGGVDAVQFATNGSMGAGDTANLNFSEGVDITSDVSKRVLRLHLNVDTLDSAANLTVRVEDHDGDYYFAEIDSDRNATNETTITNGTNTGVVFQERLSNLNSSGTVDEIASVKVHVKDADATITVSGMDVGGKTIVDLGETMVDTDGDGELDDVETKQELPEGGVLNLTSIDTLGSWTDDAIVHDLEVYNVNYRVTDISESDRVSVEFSEATESGAYSQKLEVWAFLDAPTYIDVSYGSNAVVEVNQTMIGERYATFEYAADVDDSKDFKNLSMTDKSDLIGSRSDDSSDWRTLDASPVAGQTSAFHIVLWLQDGEAAAAKPAENGGATGPVDSGSGGFLSMVFSLPGAILTAIGAFLARGKIARLFGRGG